MDLANFSPNSARKHAQLCLLHWS